MSELSVWQDREIRFDIPVTQLSKRKGENIVELIKNIEDTKGNSGESGSLTITNLRLIWSHHGNSRINLSIGYDCIISIEIKISYSNSMGSSQSLNIRSKFNQSRFEFIFTTIKHESPRIFTTFQAVCRAYENTKLYRDLKLRGAIIQDKNLNMLGLENIINKHSNVWNLSSDQGNVGCFIFTNIRVVWYSNVSENFNISIPYIQIKLIKKRESKFGSALVIETTQLSGGYLLGFQAENMDVMTIIN
jgi:Bardet-Biedl syndrome 5 protein